MSGPEPEPWPTELRIRRNERCLEIDFDSGERYVIPAELLRVESPSAEVKGHGSGAKRIVSGKRNVAILSAEAVGNYAVRLAFDDGHDTGLYSWSYLHRLGRDQAAIWQAYLDALAARHLTRDR